MRASVAAAWPDTCAALEGRLEYAYLDSLSLLTFGIGQLGESIGLPTDFYLSRPWRDKDGRLVTEAKIRGEFAAIKERVDLAMKGGRAFSGIATLHLADADIDEALLQTTADFWAILLRALPELETWPADAQLALLNMAWNLGPRFLSGWPDLSRSLAAQDWLRAAEGCKIAGKPSQRNRWDRILFTQAARAVQFKADPERLYGVDVTISATKLDAAQPDKPDATGWWVQRMLGLAGFPVVLDGLYGPQSRDAYARYGRARKLAGMPTQRVLTALAAETLQVTVTA